MVTEVFAEAEAGAVDPATGCLGADGFGCKCKAVVSMNFSVSRSVLQSRPRTYRRCRTASQVSIITGAPIWLATFV